MFQSYDRSLGPDSISRMCVARYISWARRPRRHTNYPNMPFMNNPPLDHRDTRNPNAPPPTVSRTCSRPGMHNKETSSSSSSSPDASHQLQCLESFSSAPNIIQRDAFETRAPPRQSPSPHNDTPTTSQTTSPRLHKKHPSYDLHDDFLNDAPAAQAAIDQLSHQERIDFPHYDLEGRDVSSH
ncbi:hypothetical protein BDZ97DRAFT_701472 [Flammula alnicola]|nr:hypothetical protein BDZ97DRAFT_701472 [Flammula alnicola]